MDKYRFKQLLESTMGNVKPLITEEFSEEMSDGDLYFVKDSLRNLCQ